MSPVDATGVRLYAAGPDGRVRPLESYLPPIPPVPQKDERALPPPPAVGYPADHPGESQGFLSGRAIYLSQWHGWIWYDSLGRFSTQRGNNYDTVEDFHNPEAMDQYLTAYLENAGAKVFTVKERDLNPLAVVLDDDAPDTGGRYRESGSGFTDGAAGWAAYTTLPYGEDPFSRGGTRRFPADGGAVASWEPTVPEDGWYAVYVSWDSNSQNATRAHYRLTHPGGVIDRYFDQTVHGHTWQYVEHLWLPAGTSGLTVALVGDGGEAGRYLSADAVRIGGGMGDVERHGKTTGRPRFEEGAILGTQDNGAPTSVYDYTSSGDGSDPSSRSRWAAWEHPTGEDALYLSWHSNAAGTPDTARGTTTYIYNGSSGSPVTGSYDLAVLVEEELVSAFDALWESGWTDRGVRSDAFSEVNPSHNPEMPAILIELAFHDHYLDVEYLKHPRFRQDAARAMTRGIVRYFADRDGLTPHFQPEPPVDLALLHENGGQLVASWAAGPAGDPYGDAATSWLLFTSPDGRAWDNGTAVASTSTVLDTHQGQTVYVRVAGVNAGGVSLPSEVVGARRSPDGWAPVLIVAAFDRLEVGNLIWEDPGAGLGEVVRMPLRRVNAGDTAVAHGAAVAEAGWYFDTISDKRLGDLDLAAYPLIWWVAGEEASNDETFSHSQQALLRAYGAAGGALWATGSEILWDLDERGDATDLAFASEVLGATMADDDADTWDAEGAGLLAGLSLDFGEDDGAPYPAEYPDVLSSERAVLATYPSAGTAAVLGGGVALFGFPFECIGDAEVRAEVAARLLPALVPDYDPGDPGDTGTPGDSTAPDDSGADDDSDHGGDHGGPRFPEGGCGCVGGAAPVGVLVTSLGLLGLAWRRRQDE